MRGTRSAVTDPLVRVSLLVPGAAPAARRAAGAVYAMRDATTAGELEAARAAAVRAETELLDTARSALPDCPGAPGNPGRVLRPAASVIVTGPVTATVTAPASQLVSAPCLKGQTVGFSPVVSPPSPSIRLILFILHRKWRNRGANLNYICRCYPQLTKIIFMALNRGFLNFCPAVQIAISSRYVTQHQEQTFYSWPCTKRFTFKNLPNGFPTEFDLIRRSRIIR